MNLFYNKSYVCKTCRALHACILSMQGQQTLLLFLLGMLLCVSHYNVNFLFYNSLFELVGTSTYLHCLYDY